MNDAVIGIIGTLAGTIVGFGMTWLKERLDERRAVQIEIESLVIRLCSVKEDPYWKIGSNPYHTVEYKIRLLVHNRSSVQQPVWGMHLSFQNGDDLYRVPLMYYDKEGSTLQRELEIVGVAPKSTEIIDAKWKLSSKETRNIILDSKVFLTYKTFVGELGKEVVPVVAGSHYKFTV